MTSIFIQINVPEMTIEKYAQETGLSKRTVDGMIQRGYLPSVKTGKRRMVNVALRMAECLEQRSFEYLGNRIGKRESEMKKIPFSVR